MIVKKLFIIQKVYLKKLLKKVDQVFEILKIQKEKMAVFKKSLKYIKERTRAAQEKIVMVKLRKYLYRIDQLSSAIFAKNKQLFY